MTDYKVHYPNYNVLDEKEHWDTHTRNIVDNRLETSLFYPYQFFTQQEAALLFQLCSVLLDDANYSVIAFVVHHLDTTLQASIGEAQRKIDVPKWSVLIREGLARIGQACLLTHGNSFEHLEEAVKKEIVNDLMQGSFPLQPDQKPFPISDFMQKFLTETVASYYSHPAIWSEIGYAGPAYPRGYVRSGLGLTDPWEAKRDGE